MADLWKPTPYRYDPGKPVTVANYPLLANPRAYYYTQRQGPILFCTLHILVGIEDWTPPDDSAEAGIRYGQTCTRPASWSATADADTARDCLPDQYVAFAQGVPGSPYSYNTHGYGIEIGARSTDWTAKPDEWIEATLRNVAALCAPRHIRYGWKLKHVTLSQLNADLSTGRPSGYIGHAEITPSTRSDPGWVGSRDTFPWSRFLGILSDAIAALTGDPDVLARQRESVAAGLLTPADVDGIDGPRTQAAWRRYMATLDDISSQLARLIDRVDTIPWQVWSFPLKDKDASFWVRFAAGGIKTDAEGRQVPVVVNAPPLDAPTEAVL